MAAGSNVVDKNLMVATELRLGLPGSGEEEDHEKTTPARAGNKRTAEGAAADEPRSPSSTTSSGGETAPPPAKAQVVGWPPIRSHRRNMSFQQEAKKKQTTAVPLSSTTPAEAGGGGALVKVSMDGAPYLRKVDLKLYNGYKDMREALEDMFRCFSPAVEVHDYAVTYKDKDGDLMLAGDVPWGMFISTCRRLRMMKMSEARGFMTASGGSSS